MVAALPGYPAALKTRSGSYTFQTIPYEYKNCETWPSSHTPTATELAEWFSHLSQAQAEERAAHIAERFERLQRAIKIYLTTGSLKQALAEAACTKEVFYRQLSRCLLPNPVTGEGIVGWAGLISQLRLKGYTRVDDGKGTAGQFQKWISESQEWRELLHRMILKGSGGKRLAGRKPAVRAVARNFIKAFSKPPGENQQPKIPLARIFHASASGIRFGID